MNAASISQQLTSDKSYWESIADHYSEQATIDSQSNFTLRFALEKLATIDRSLRRIALGTFGRCDVCGGAIEAERLEVLLDSDCHRCAVCAKTKSHVIEQRPAANDRRPARQIRSQYPLPAYQAHKASRIHLAPNQGAKP